MTVAPSSAGSNTFHMHLIFPSFSKIETAASAISEKLCVANANIVGPAPLRHIPNRPGCVDGVRELRIVVRPGIKVER